ncbi:hypothetical protein [Lysobacter gummosus]
MNRPRAAQETICKLSVGRNCAACSMRSAICRPSAGASSCARSATTIR